MTTSVTDQMLDAASTAFMEAWDGKHALWTPHAMVAMRKALEAALRSQGKVGRCPHCDDTGDVHSVDGEWRGKCSCVKVVNTDDLIALRDEVRVQASLKDHYADWEETERMFTAIIGEGD